jgi:hypothetical protein
MVAPQKTTSRVRTFSREGDVPVNYRETYGIPDERTKQTAAFCDVSRHTGFSPVTIIDENRKTRTMRPDRKILPAHRVPIDRNQSPTCNSTGIYRIDRKIRYTESSLHHRTVKTKRFPVPWAREEV